MYKCKQYQQNKWGKNLTEKKKEIYCLKLWAYFYITLELYAKENFALISYQPLTFPIVNLFPSFKISGPNFRDTKLERSLRLKEILRKTKECLCG